MNIPFINSFQSEWLKKQRSAADWLTIVGSFFIPVILLIGRMTDFDRLYKDNLSPHVWELLYSKAWQFMSIFLLPMGVILATSLITQLEFRNNTWKQLHTTPQSFSTIFFTKLAVILVMMFQFFVLFSIGIYLSGVIPCLVFKAVAYPQETFPFMKFLKSDLKFFIDCLPIIALQYLISRQFKNFLVPLGVGIGLYVSSMIAISWKYGYIVPYTYCSLYFLAKGSDIDQKVNIHYWAIGYFVVFTVAGYLLYMLKKEKG